MPRTYKRIKPLVPFLAILLSVLVVNLPYISQKYDPNPINVRTELRDNGVAGTLPGLHTIDPNDGYTKQALGHRAVLDLHHGKMPWWNHYEGVGAPLAGEMQSAALFPPILLLGFSNGVLLLQIFLEIIAGICTYLLLKRLRCSTFASVVGGIAFAANGTFAWFMHAPVNPIPFLPMLLYGIELAFSRSTPKQRGGWLVIALALSLSLYAGFPETAFLNGLFAAGWALTRLIRTDRDTQKAFLAKLITGGVLGIMLASPILIAFVDYLPYANVGAHAGATIHVLTAYGLPALVMPYIFGPIFAFSVFDHSNTLLGWWGSVGGYLPVSIVLAAIFGFSIRVKKTFQSRLSVFLAGWSLFAIGASYGLLWLNEVAGRLPVLSAAAYYRYLPATYELAAVILVGFCLTWLNDRKYQFSRKQIVIGGSLASGGLLLLILYALRQLKLLTGAPHLKLWVIASAGWALLAIVVFITVLISRNSKVIAYRQILLGTFIAVDCAIMIMIPMFSAPKQATVDLRPVVFLKEHLGTARFFSLGPIAPNYGSYYSIASININDLPLPKTWSDHVTRDLYNNVDPILFTGTNMADPKGDTPLQGFIKNLKNYEYVGVKYIIVPHSMPNESYLTDAGLKAVYHDGTADIFELPDPQPYATLAEVGCMVHTTDWDNLTTDCTRPTTLNRKELFMPGWAVRVDGKKAELRKDGDLFQSVALPAGKHRVAFTYNPPHIHVAYVLFGFALMTIAATTIYGYKETIRKIYRARMLK